MESIATSVKFFRGRTMKLHFDRPFIGMIYDMQTDVVLLQWPSTPWRIEEDFAHLVESVEGVLAEFGDGVADFRERLLLHVT